MNKNTDVKKCPRCHSKLYSNAEKCIYCGLLFSRIQNLSNKQAKKEIRNRNHSRVLNIKTRPEDVSKKKLILLTIFTGIFGGHNFYVGKYKKAWFSLISTVFFIITFTIYLVSLNNGIILEDFRYYIVESFGLFTAISCIMLMFDIISLITKTFTYPAAIPEDELSNIMMKTKSKKQKQINKE